MQYNSNLINYKLKQIIKDLEKIEKFDRRISEAINFLAKVTLDYPAFTPDQLEFNLNAKYRVLK